MGRFVKLDAGGHALPEEAAGWVAVKDTHLRLWWSVAESEKMPQGKALAAAAAMQLAGCHDWRLPFDELFALADRSRFNPSIAAAYFPQCKPGADIGPRLAPPTRPLCAPGSSFSATAAQPLAIKATSGSYAPCARILVKHNLYQ
jgi:hypothetical protein